MASLAEKKPLDFTALVDGDTGTINPDLLDDFKFGNQRGKRTDTEFSDLCESVKLHGVFTPITVRFNPEKPNRLEVVAGHGRRDAAKAATTDDNSIEVPFLFIEADDDKAFEIHYSENNDREQLDIIAKSKAVLRYMTQFLGDVEAVASKLNIKPKECRELIELNKCSDKVHQAIVDGHISPSHAIALAPFPKSAQDKNLPTIIAEKWTVRTLRERVGKAKLPLDRGVFDKSECDNCAFNTVPQLGLFGSTDTKAECAKPTCFQAKTTAHMETQKAQLTSKYGHILLLSQTSESDRSLVSAEIVGAAQFETCGSCENRVAVLSDSWGKAGEITENQCVDKTCFNTCKSAFAKEVTAQQAEIAKTTSGSPEEQATQAKKQAVTTAKSTAKATLPPSVLEHYKKIMRSAAGEFFAKNDDFIASLLTAALVSHAQLTGEGETSSRFSDILVKCLGMTQAERQALSKEAAAEFLNKTDSDSDNGNVTDTLIRCLTHEKETALPFVSAFWMPTKENLDIYTKKLLKPLAESAGVKTQMESSEKGSFGKLLNKSKPDLITGIQSSSVDWESYAPKSFTSLISK